jgi:DNA-binding transcriptional ArsR family regulator
MSTIVPPGLVVARDLEIVDWLDRLVGASVEQIRERFGLGRTQAYRRLQVLQDHGLVRRRHLSAILPPLYTVRSRSLRLASTEHAHALTELVVSIEASGGEVATELELRRQRHRQPALAGPLIGEQLATVRSCPRVPDAAELLGSGGLRAFEVELSSKGRGRRAAVLAAYATSAYEAVTWIAPDPQLRDLISREVAEHGLADFMEVRDAL